MARIGQNLELFKNSSQRQFGGLLLKGNAKIARPVSTKLPIHLVLKSHVAVGPRSLLHRRNAGRVGDIIRQQAAAKGIRVYHFVNVGNHLHLVLRIQHASRPAGQRAFSAFLRAISGLIARHVLRAERGAAQGIKFWQARPFTRIASWGREFRALSDYMTKNSKQARGLVAWGFTLMEPESG